MRTKILLSLLAFTVAPLLASAATPPALTTYTVSDNIIYPSGPGAMFSAIDVAFSEPVGVSIRIVSKDGESILFYSSTSVTNPKSKNWDGTNSGIPVSAGVYTIIISAKSVATNLEMSDSSKTITVSSSAEKVIASSTPSSGAATTYVPPPSAISIQISGSQDAVREVPIHLSAKVTMKGGTVDSAARIVWSFGDGSSDTGIEVDKTYRYAGSYLVVATAYDGSVTARDDFLVRVIPAQARISLVTEEGITITNDSDTRLDLSLWRLVVDTGFFRIPEGTIIMPKSSVMFPFVVINLPALQNATLLYPSGILAYRYEHIESPINISATTSIAKVEKPVEEKLDPEKTSYISVQKVEEVINTKTSVKPNETEPVIAPTAVVEPLAVGAASVALAPSASLFKSVWALGLLGVIALAGVAFVLL